MGVTIRLNLAFDPSLLRILNYYLENDKAGDWHLQEETLYQGVVKQV